MHDLIRRKIPNIIIKKKFRRSHFKISVSDYDGLLEISPATFLPKNRKAKPNIWLI